MVDTEYVRDHYGICMVAEGAVLEAVGRRYGIERYRGMNFPESDLELRTRIMDAIAQARTMKVKGNDSDTQ